MRYQTLQVIGPYLSPHQLYKDQATGSTSGHTQPPLSHRPNSLYSLRVQTDECVIWLQLSC